MARWRYRHYRAHQTAALKAIGHESADMISSVSESNTKYMLSTCGKLNPRLRPASFAVVNEFAYIVPAVTSKNDASLKMKRWITLANRCYNRLSKQLSVWGLSRAKKFLLYKSFIFNVLFYGAKAWTQLTSAATALGVFKQSFSYSNGQRAHRFWEYFERKILCKVYDQYNKELYDHFYNMDEFHRINI